MKVEVVDEERVVKMQIYGVLALQPHCQDRAGRVLGLTPRPILQPLLLPLPPATMIDMITLPQ